MFAKTKQGEKNLPKPAVWHLFLIKCPQIFFVSKSIHSDSPILPLSQSELLLKLFFYGEHEKRNEERSQDFCINELSRLRDPGCALSLTMHSRCFCPLLSLFMQSSKPVVFRQGRNVHIHRSYRSQMFDHTDKR